MSGKEQMTLKCTGPNKPWYEMSATDRFEWMITKADSGVEICGESTVAIDTSVPDDFWPEYCPKCGTDVNWDIAVVAEMQMLEKKLGVS